MDYLKEYYDHYNEDDRLLKKHGNVEYITTMKYIHEYLHHGNKICEIGAGTGRYSLALAAQGYSVTAIELIKTNLEKLQSQITDTMDITCMQANALDLSNIPDHSFDVTLLLGPMYHLYTKEDQIQALKEALRVTKKNGYLFVAYCMNEATMIQFAFLKNQVIKLQKEHKITEDYHAISHEEDVFTMYRIEEIDSLNSLVDAHRIKILATDGATNYIKNYIDQCDEDTFKEWLAYHLATCERKDLIGASNHTLDILQKQYG